MGNVELNGECFFQAQTENSYSKAQRESPYCLICRMERHERRKGDKITVLRVSD
jgi:hypothetical protein